MAELATIARPYAEALFKSSKQDLAGTAGWLDALAAIAGDRQMLQLADNPKITNQQVFDVFIVGVRGLTRLTRAALTRTAAFRELTLLVARLFRIALGTTVTALALSTLAALSALARTAAAPFALVPALIAIGTIRHGKPP